MAQVYKKLILDVNKSNPGIIAEAVQNDAQSRFLDIVLVDGSTPIDLTGHEVRIYGKKFDGTEFYNNGEITEPINGRCQFEMTSQALAVANDLEMQIKIFYNNVEILSTQSFKIMVVKDLMSGSAIESSNEYGALVVLYQNLYEAYDLMTEMVQKIGVPKEQAIALGLDTMFEVWDWMVEYLQANSTAGIVETVNTVLSRIGAHDSVSQDTVMGKLNKIDKQVPLIFDKYVGTNLTINTSTPRGTVYSFSGSGEVAYISVIQNKNFKIDSVNFILDGLTMVTVNGTITAETYRCYAVESKHPTWSGSDSREFLPVRVSQFPVTINNNTASVNAIATIFDTLKFDSSLEVVVEGDNMSGNLYFDYRTSKD